MIVTVDTNVIISALGWEGPEFELMNLIFNGKITLAISPQILEEFINVARSTKFDFSDDEIDDFVDALLNTGKVVFPEEYISLIKEDPPDNRILECAEVSNSRYIITGNKHLLQLDKYKRIKIMNGADFFRKVLKI